MFSQFTALGGSYQMGYCYMRHCPYEFIHPAIIHWMPTGPSCMQDAGAAVMNGPGIVSALMEAITYRGNTN